MLGGNAMNPDDRVQVGKVEPHGVDSPAMMRNFPQSSRTFT